MQRPYNAIYFVYELPTRINMVKKINATYELHEIT